ncbi:MAG: nucleotidyltransferase family protein [Anaerolineae bacterium]|nr:nucleotidyltransferase family protein [Anaerolineae bacterium]MDW8101085.1 nucleotidyltransferase family protein [Anaerolineae bacterium]
MISAIVLAAGASQRMGCPKLLLPLGDKLVIEHVVHTVTATNVDEAIVVVGHWRAEMEQVLAGLPVRVAFNPDYARGEMLSSVQVGLKAASPMATAALIALGDQPQVSVATMNRIAAALRGEDDRICLPIFGGRRGHPIGLPRRFWSEVLSIGQGGSLREVIRRHQDAIAEIPVPDDAILSDMDTLQEYARLLAHVQLSGRIA